MYILFTDETARNAGKDAPFFIYGGIFLTVAEMGKLHAKIVSTRAKYGFRHGDSLKFAERDRPNHVSKENYTKAKDEVIEACKACNVRFIAVVVLHNIAAKLKPDTLIKWGANTVVGGYHKFLNSVPSQGVVVFDRLPIKKPFAYLVEKFVRGLVFPDGKELHLSRIISYSMSCDNASHIASALDVLIGSFQYCVNRWDKDEAPKKMLPRIVGLMWHRRSADKIFVRDYGLCFRPKEVTVADHKQKYDKLVERLNGLLRAAKDEVATKPASGAARGS